MFLPARRTRLLPAALVAAALCLTAACSTTPEDSADGAPSPTADPGDPNAVSGEILVLTWRTDRVEDGTFDRYVEEFNKTYPDVTVTHEGITDYEGVVKTRMSTEEYGDVLGIVNTLTPEQLPDFFEPLGTIEEIEADYRWVRDKAFDGKAYGIPVVGNTQGIVYNKKVWAAAGLDVAVAPSTPAEFLSALTTIKSAVPDAVPLYTNYKDGWPLTQWEGHRGSITADPEFANKLTGLDDPWAAGRDHHVIDSLLWDAVAQGLTEADPTTTNWEESKTLLATGKIATMVLGSWAISQMQAAAVEAGGAAEDIGYLPFPHQVDGTFYASVGGDYNLGINVHSENKAAARAWIDWFNHESGFAEDEGGLSPLVDGTNPENLKDFDTFGVEFVAQNPAPAGKEALLNDIDNEAEIGLWQPEYRQQLVDAARGAASTTKDEFFSSLNERWKNARASIG